MAELGAHLEDLRASAAAGEVASEAAASLEARVDGLQQVGVAIALLQCMDGGGGGDERRREEGGGRRERRPKERWKVKEKVRRECVSWEGGKKEAHFSLSPLPPAFSPPSSSLSSLLLSHHKHAFQWLTMMMPKRKEKRRRMLWRIPIKE